MQGFETHGLPEGTELPGMLATFSSYQDLFGPCHPLTLRLLTELGIMLWRHRRTNDALIVLQQGLRDSTRAFGRNHDLRLRLLATLRDLFMELADCEKAAAAQKELLDRYVELFGAEHTETCAARETLERLLLQNPASDAA